MVTILALQAGRAGPLVLVAQLALFIGIMYFLFVLPQRREAKRHREMLESLRPGLEVATSGGLVGEIVMIRDERVTLKSGDARVVVERARIMRVLTPPSAAGK